MKITPRGPSSFAAIAINLLTSATTIQSIKSDFHTRHSFLAAAPAILVAFSSSASSAYSASSKMVDTSTSSSTSPPPLTTKQDRKTASIWDKFAETYSKSPIEDEEAYQKKLEITQSYMDESTTKNVIEIGCGTGGTALKHSPFVGGTYLATDISPKMIDIAKERLEESTVESKGNIEYRVASVDTLNETILKQSQDMVLGLSILHLLPNRLEEMRKVSSWLKPGGLFVTSTVCAADMGFAVKIIFKTVLPVGNYFGFVPKVCAVQRDELKQDFVDSGFTIVHEWQPKKDAAVFIIGKRN